MDESVAEQGRDYTLEIEWSAIRGYGNLSQRERDERESNVIGVLAKYRLPADEEEYYALQDRLERILNRGYNNNSGPAIVHVIDKATGQRWAGESIEDE